ncbi:hypothetical protein [Constrictibacter sp. MBR-5]|uniref:hypothetical protein n=1 Tax=Constrictibacter sp. MBR-5 TaxID=3156467 RepID=UPI003394A201
MDRDLLAAIGEVATASTALEHVLHLVIKRLHGGGWDAGMELAQKNRNTWKAKCQIAAKIFPGSAAAKPDEAAFKDLLARIEAAGRDRGAYIHSFVFRTRAGAELRLNRDTPVSPDVDQVRDLAARLWALMVELNRAVPPEKAAEEQPGS